MISPNRLFLVPALSAFLILIPIIGVFIWIIICCNWYIKNQTDIHNYFKGINYKQNEISESVIDEFK